jgi:multidrug transporter EmrE-like cation transporter
MNQRFDIAGLAYVACTILLTVYGQLVLKWQINAAGQMPPGLLPKVSFLAQQFLNPWILSGLAAALLASVAWMAAMTRLPLNYAYPFTSLAFVLVMLFSVAFLGESVSASRLVGTLLVISGLLVIASN